MIGGLDSPTSGRIYFEEEEITQASPARLTEIRLKKMGFVFQAYNLIPVLTALENVEYVMLLQGVSDRGRKNRALEALVEVGLKDCFKRRPLELSGGQQQRVAVARAIVTCPRIVLADEPTANLDSKTGAGLMDLLADLNRRKGITFVFFTHDPVVVERTRRVVRLKDGKIEE
jgi:putative ABC transport system ATP-binding protein